ncbi:MAG: hypothetical protein Q8N00_01380 [Nitrospirota bacterium]|nr:hypothetical protein [Nitrospirota bacterium]MDP3595956.1 hypothetical protein [Nitrospirota bacterium]
MSMQWFKGVLVWVVVADVVMVGLTIFVLHVFDRQIIEQTGAQDLHEEFLRDAKSVKRIMSKAGDFYDITALMKCFKTSWN